MSREGRSTKTLPHSQSTPNIWRTSYPAHRQFLYPPTTDLISMPAKPSTYHRLLAPLPVSFFYTPPSTYSTYPRAPHSLIAPAVHLPTITSIDSLLITPMLVRLHIPLPYYHLVVHTLLVLPHSLSYPLILSSIFTFFVCLSFIGFLVLQVTQFMIV